MKNKQILLLNSKEMESIQPIIYQAKLHWISYISPVFYAVIGSIGILPLFIMKGTFQIVALLLVFLFCRGILKIWRNKTTKIFISDGLLSISSGIFSKTTIDVSLSKMETMQLNQNIIGKIFNYGSLIVTTGEISYSYNISDPESLRQMIIKEYRG